MLDQVTTMKHITMTWEEEWRQCLTVVGGALWIQKKMQRREPLDEEGCDAVMQNMCFISWRCAST